jgi:hypothetical protein
VVGHATERNKKNDLAVKRSINLLNCGTYAVEGTFGVDKRKGTRNIDISSALQFRTFWSDKNVFKIKLDIIDNSHGAGGDGGSR